MNPSAPLLHTDSDAVAATAGASPLTDLFGRAHTYLRISVTERCNLRCAYCHPDRTRAAGQADTLTFDEIATLARVFASLGVTKVRVTGGEPLLRPGTVQLIEALRRIEGLRTVALTTNGVLLAVHVHALKAAGLTNLNVSLDSLKPDRFERITLRDAHKEVLAGIDAALQAGFAPLKLNVVVLAGVNDDELLDFVELARDRSFAVRFIERMPFACSDRLRSARLVPYVAMRRRIEERYRLIPAGTPAQVAKEFRIDGFTGTVGFITSMSHRFCGGCNRMRLRADGALMRCLFMPPTVNLGAALRAGASEAELAALMRSELRRKEHERPNDGALADPHAPCMLAIGG